ncbi:MAG: MerR family transcriptional regulator [Lachnospiraceae bacterium]|nr:MerR family transcriptional regulator [Lachnospiraceae bacterium]
MRTISQVAKLTGISTRTLQYYDEIGLLKPSEITDSGYRLYNDDALQELQQILFFKELGFKLMEIKEILQRPDFDRIAAFKKQKELLLLKRNRTDRLIQLLERLEKGEQCMSFKEFDLTEYIEVLEDFKTSNVDDVVRHWGSVGNFDLFIRKIKDDEPEVAKLAIKHYGSVEKYTEAMKDNLEHFSEKMDKLLSDDAIKAGQQSHDLYAKLTADLSKDCSSEEIQDIVGEIVAFTQELATAPLGEEFWNATAHAYSSEFVKNITDTKYGAGASEYIVKAFECYVKTHFSQSS